MESKRTFSLHALIGVLAAGVLMVGLMIAVSPTESALAAQAEGAPLTASTIVETQATDYWIWVQGKMVTSANKDNVLGDKRKSVRYNPSTRTLTLNNANIKGGRTWAAGNNANYRAAIEVRLGDITIVLKGKNVITGTGKVNVGNYGICALGDSGASNVSIKGSGNLKVTAGKAGLYSNGIYCNDLNIQGGAKVTVKGGGRVKTSFKPGSTAGSIGVYNTGNVTLSGSAKLVATGKTRALLTAPTFGQSYTPQVKAGASAKSIKVNKKNPAKSVYTKYKYVEITKAAAASKKPAKLSISVKPGGSMLSVSWKALSKNCTGYQLQLSKKSSFASGSTWTFKTSKKATGATLTKLSGGSKYYVRVRGMNKVGSKTYYGAWSATKSATTYYGEAAG